MARPESPPFLVPRQPETVLGWSMQKFRQVHGWSGKQVAEAYGCRASHISRVEHGKMPTADLVRLYDDTFGAEGLLWSIYLVAYRERTRKRQRIARRIALMSGAPGDASEFLGDTVPNGTLMRPGHMFTKTWYVRNSGQVVWRNRSLERQGPLTGPGLITSPRSVPINDADPGGEVAITVPLKAPTYDCAAIAYFKMVDEHGNLCFPDNYQLGLEVIVVVRGQLPDKPSVVEAYRRG